MKMSAKIHLRVNVQGDALFMGEDIIFPLEINYPDDLDKINAIATEFVIKNLEVEVIDTCPIDGCRCGEDHK